MNVSGGAPDITSSRANATSITPQLYTPVGVAREEDYWVPCMDQVLELSSKARRFNVEPSAADKAEQKLRSARLLQGLNLRVFAPADEAEFEDWCDDAAPMILKVKLCADLVYEALEAACSPVVRNVLKDVGPKETTEELWDCLARRLYATSDYHWVVLEEIVGMQPQTSVMMSQHALGSRVARYLRLVRRHRVKCALTDEWLMRAAHRGLPVDVEPQVMLWSGGAKMREFYEWASRIEMSVRHRRAFPAVKADVPALPASEPRARSRSRGARVSAPEEATSECHCCGMKGH